jgi:hypothetical protein
MPQYSYSLPSLGSDSIRLLRLMPNEDVNAPIQCRLHNYPLQKLDEGTHLYEALSYVWGGSDTPQSVFIDQCGLPVTVNLYNALSRLRDRAFERILWVDSICINQADEQEKEHQIQSMAKIYGQANRVIVYLGEAADDSDQALEDIRVAAADEFLNILQGEKDQEAISAASDDSDQALEDIRVAAEDETLNLLQSGKSQKDIIKLLERPWFRRIWVS